MGMSVEAALCALGIDKNPINREIIKQKYRLMARKYHPDKNPEGLKIMQDVNVAYKFLRNIPDHMLILSDNDYQPPEEESKSYRKPDGYHETDVSHESDIYDETDGYRIFRELGLSVWEQFDMILVDGKTFDHRDLLKQYHFRWNPNMKAWWRPK